jgi:penicillin-binding protein 2
VVNGSGTGVGSKININGVQMAGKTGTAQVRKLVSRGQVGDWKSRDHALFICYAPADKPRYAMAVLVEHGTFGARAAAPIAKDVMTFLFDRDTAMASLESLETAWGGDLNTRMARSLASYKGQQAAPPPPEPSAEPIPAAENKAQ